MNDIDIVTHMLRFGKSNLVNGFTKQELTNDLTSKGYELEKVTNTVSLYFSNYFAYNTVNGIENDQTKHFLKPNGYFDLLQIENTLESRKQSKRALRIAIISIVISGLPCVGCNINNGF